MAIPDAEMPIEPHDIFDVVADELRRYPGEELHLSATSLERIYCHDRVFYDTAELGRWITTHVFDADIATHTPVHNAFMNGALLALHGIHKTSTPAQWQIVRSLHLGSYGTELQTLPDYTSDESYDMRQADLYAYAHRRLHETNNFLAATAPADSMLLGQAVIQLGYASGAYKREAFLQGFAHASLLEDALSIILSYRRVPTQLTR